ncbi:PEP-CTERM sorting domain-containing protein [Planctomycetota bacterium]|nr:PEP-CTERM sorting domain-containing protein [Planctomycetota bacterium]
MVRKELALCALLLCGFGIGTAADATIYRVEFGVIEDVGDEDANDGFDYLSITGGEMIFTISDNLQMDLNEIKQDGSSTYYSGITFDELTFNTTGGDEVFALNSDVELELWDRLPGAPGGWNYMTFGAGDIDDGIEFELRTNTIHANHGNIFNLGTPNPNTLIDGKLITFADEVERDSIYYTPYIYFYGTGASLPNGYIEMYLKSLQIVPEPSSLSLIGLSGLLMLRRRG